MGKFKLFYFLIFYIVVLFLLSACSSKKLNSIIENDRCNIEQVEDSKKRSSPTPHIRSEHKRTFSHERYINKRHQTILIKETYVKGKSNKQLKDK